MQNFYLDIWFRDGDVEFTGTDNLDMDGWVFVFPYINKLIIILPKNRFLYNE